MLGFIGFLVMIQGFGSAIAYLLFDSRKWGFLLRWAYDYQPYAGILAGLLGIAIIVWGDQRSKARDDDD